MANKITGKIVQVLPLQSGVSQRGTSWSRQEYILEVQEGRYYKKVCVHVLGDNIARLALREGLECTLLVSIESREWKDRWYTQVEAYAREDLLAQAQPQTQATHAPNGAGSYDQVGSIIRSSTPDHMIQNNPQPQPEDDLPF